MESNYGGDCCWVCVCVACLQQTNDGNQPTGSLADTKRVALTPSDSRSTAAMMEFNVNEPVKWGQKQLIQGRCPCTSNDRLELKVRP